MDQERGCTHYSGQHPYHYSLTELHEDGKVYEHFHCGHCDKLVRSMRIK